MIRKIIYIFSSMVLLISVVINIGLFLEKGEDIKRITMLENDIRTMYVELDKKTNHLRELEANENRAHSDIVSYITAHYKTVPSMVADEIATQIIAASAKHGVSYSALMGIVEQESSFNPFAIGSHGERGLMQVMPKWWVDKLGLDNQFQLHDIAIGIDAGARILKAKMGQEGSFNRGIMKYNGNNREYANTIYEKIGRFTLYRTTLEVQDKKNNEVSNKESNRGDTVLDTVSDNDKSLDRNGSGYVLYKIKKGDTLGDLAKKYLGAVNKWKQIQNMNPGITPERLKIGTNIMIPTGK